MPKPKRPEKWKWRMCRSCKELIDPEGSGDQLQVQHTNRLYYHHECLEMLKWRKESEHAKPRRGGGKAPHATNGRIIKSARGLA